VIGPHIGSIIVVAIALPQGLHVAALCLLAVVAVREFQSYVINPHLMGGSVGLSPLVTLVSVAVVSVIFGSFAVILAVPFTSAVATLIDVFVLQHDPPEKQQRRSTSITQRIRARTDATGHVATDSAGKPAERSARDE
jgi:predicted PurR-regulated permease PerM